MSSEGSSSKDSDTFMGIPKVEYIEDIAKHAADFGEGGAAGADGALKVLEERHQRYKQVEAQLAGRKRRLEGKLPDLRASLDLVHVLQEKAAAGEEMRTRFVLSEQALAQARIPPTEKVCLWLGANVMLEYSLGDADALLEKNIKGAEDSLKAIAIQMDFLKDQTTTTEVNIARVYNWGVAQKKAAAPANAPAAARA